MQYLLLFSQLIKELSFIANEEYLTLFPEEVLPQKILEGNKYFREFKSNFLDNGLTRENYRDSEKYRDIEIKKEFNLEVVKEQLISSQDLKMFLEKFIKSKREINEGIYKGIFGLEIKVSEV